MRHRRYFAGTALVVVVVLLVVLLWPHGEDNGAIQCGLGERDDWLVNGHFLAAGREIVEVNGVNDDAIVLLEWPDDHGRKACEIKKFKTQIDTLPPGMCHTLFRTIYPKQTFRCDVLDGMIHKIAVPCDVPCYYTQDVRVFPRANALIFAGEHLMDESTAVPPKDVLSQSQNDLDANGDKTYAVLPKKWILSSMESVVNYPYMVKDLYWDGFWDARMGYRQDWDIHRSSMRNWKTSAAALKKFPLMERNSAVPLVWIASNCNAKTGRLPYVQALMQHISVDSYGACEKNKEEEIGGSFGQTLEVYSKYYFAIAFENSVTQDYVTEKAFVQLQAGAIPIYVGAPNAREFFPENAVIYADDFSGPKELAAHIQHIMDGTIPIEKYHAWRTQPISPQLEEKYTRDEEGNDVGRCLACQWQAKQAQV